MILLHGLFWLTILSVILLLGAVLSISWSHAILPRFLRRSFLLFLSSIVFYLLLCGVLDYLFIISALDFSLFPAVFTILNVVAGVIIVFPLMEIIFYFLDVSLSSSRIVKIMLFAVIAAALGLFLLPVPKAVYIVIGLLSSLGVWFCILIIQKKGRCNSKTDDPAVRLMQKLIIWLLLLIPLEVLEIITINVTGISEHIPIGHLTILIFVLLASVTILKTTIPFHRHRIHGTKPDAIKMDDLFLTTYILSPRETEILKILIEGKSHKAIGEKLYISPRTVDTHVHNIYKKCQVTSWKELYTLISHGDSQV